MRLTLIALLLASAPAFASVTVDYTGFSVTFSDNLTPTGIGEVTSGSGISPVNGVNYHYQQINVSGLPFLLNDVSSAGRTDVVYSITFTADPGWQLTSFESHLGGLAAGSRFPSYLATDHADYVGGANSPTQHGTSSSSGGTWQGQPVLGWNSGFASYNSLASSLTYTADLNFNGTNLDIFNASGLFSVGAIHYFDPTTLPPSPVPEPETWALLGLGLVALTARRIRARAG